MAYVSLQEKQLEDLTDSGTGAVTTLPGSTDPNSNTNTGTNASNLTQLVAAPGTAPSQFVNFQDLVDANQGATNDYAKQVGNLIGLGDTTNALATNETAANDQINSGYTDVGDDVVNRVLSNPNDTNFGGYSTLQQILGGGGYRGPTSANDIYSGAKQSLDSLSDKAGTLNDTSSLTSLLLQHPNQGTSTGGAALDAALLAGTKGSQDEISNVQKQVGELQNRYNTDLAQTQQTIAQKQAAADARRNAILGQAQGTLGGIRSQADTALQQQQAQEQERINSINNAAKAGDFATLSSLIPGLDGNQLSSIVSQLRSAPTDYTNYLNVQGPDLTQGNFVSDADRARYGGIKNIFGLTDADIAAAGRGGAQASFDMGGALASLNSRLSSQRSADAAAAQAAAQQAAAQQAAAQQAAAQQAAQQQAAAAQQPQLVWDPNAGWQWSNGGGDSTGSGGNNAGNATAPGQGGTGISNSAAAAIGMGLGVPGLGLANAAVNAIGNTVSDANATANTAGFEAAINEAQSNPNATQASIDGAAAAASAATGVGAGNSGAAASVGNGTTGSPGGNTGAEGNASNGDGGGGGGGGKIICTAMNDLYGLPYRENKIWIKYSVTHLKPEHQIGYHKIFLPLVDYGFKKGDGLSNKLVRKALEWIAVNRTKEIELELAGKPRKLWRSALRWTGETAMYVVGKWSKK
jgi:hypothetical protein